MMTMTDASLAPHDFCPLLFFLKKKLCCVAFTRRKKNLNDRPLSPFSEWPDFPPPKYQLCRGPKKGGGAGRFFLNFLPQYALTRTRVAERLKR